MKLASKIIDKLHANKQYIEAEFKGEIETKVDPQELRDFIKWRKERELKK